MIKCAKLFGFTLAEIKALIHDLGMNDMSYDQQANILAQKLDEIDARLNDMLRLKTFINRKITLLREGSSAPCTLPTLADDQPA